MNNLSNKQVRQRFDYLEDLNSRGVGTKVTSQQFEIACLRELLERREAAERPVAWIVHARGGDQLTMDGDYVANAEGMGSIHSTELFTAPPLPGMPDEMTITQAKQLYSGTKEMIVAFVDGYNARIAKMHNHIPDSGNMVNSPEIPGCWVSVNDKLPEHDDLVLVWPTPDFGVETHAGQYFKHHKKGAGWFAQVNEQNYGIEFYRINVTHWMPMPVAPKPGG